MSPPIDGKTIKALTADARWNARVKLDEALVDIDRWDFELFRKPRVLVPIDIQALYLPEDSAETFVRLPFALTTPDGADPEPMPEPFADGEKRPPGVHLHWAMPDSLLAGALGEGQPGQGNRLSMPALPDRWVVLRILIGREADKATVTGWVIDAATTRVTPLAAWPAADAAAAATGKTVDPSTLTGSVGGTTAWSAGYDGVANRFSFHDALEDVAETLPRGAIGDFGSYLVAGWWSSAALDPLDEVRGPNGLQVRLAELKWRLTDDVEDRGKEPRRRAAKQKRQSALTLTSGVRRKAFAATSASRLTTEAQAGAGIAASSLFAETVGQFGVIAKPDPHASLLHGVVHGVPIAGGVPADLRPSARGVSLAFGFHSDDAAAVLVASGLALTKPDDRRDAERLVAGFTQDLLAGVSTANGIFAIEEGEHSSAFSSRPGEPGPPERVFAPGTGAELRGTRAARSAVAGQRSVKAVQALRTELIWSKGKKGKVGRTSVETKRMVTERTDDAKTAPPPATRLIRRPTPRYFEPMEPLLAIRGARRSLRHRFAGRRSPDGRLQCRWPSQVPVEIKGVVHGRDLVTPFPAGGLPPEVVTLVRSALILDPYIAPWRAEIAGKAPGADAPRAKNRVFAETAIRFSPDAEFGVAGVARSVKRPDTPYANAVLASALNRFSLVAGVDPDPVGVTAWAQPWVPMWLEWEVDLDVTDRLDGWRLGTIDFETADGKEPEGGTKRTVSGRSPIHTGVAATLTNGILEWLKAEDERDTRNAGEVSDDVEKALEDIAGAVRGADVLSAQLDSLHDVLLGLPVGPYGVLSPRAADGTLARPVPAGAPQLLLAGRVAITRARIVDAFGRTLDLPAKGTAYPARDALSGGTAAALRPRLLRPARWMLRLVDPADLTDLSREATIDEVQPSAMVNPVAGFLLPDHIDEALEFFDSAGKPLGQLFHDGVTNGVTWEIAPGRDGPPDAGPLHGIAPAQQLLGHVAAAVVAKDAEVRAGLPSTPASESALSALLRAIDTTLWSIDTYAVLGGSSVAGLVGRPIAVVRATLRLDIKDDLDELDFADAAAKAARKAAYDDLADRTFGVRIGEITRDDDGVLGFFVDDDFSRFHVVDKVVRDSARDAGRGRGQLGLLGTTSQVPAVRPIDHPYVVAEDELVVRPGQTLRLTILMHPGGKCHLTSGLLPRKSLQLSRNWIHDGLAAIAPSARVGPVLIDSDKVRLPLIASFGTEQLWTRRDSAFTWKDDPILAATQTALLPGDPATLEEGYVRIAPLKGDEAE